MTTHFLLACRSGITRWVSPFHGCDVYVHWRLIFVCSCVFSIAFNFIRVFCEYAVNWRFKLENGYNKTFLSNTKSIIQSKHCGRTLFFTFSYTTNNSCIVDAFANIENHIHKQPDPEQLPAGHTFFSVWAVRIEPATHSTAVDHSATPPTMPSNFLK